MKRCLSIQSHVVHGYVGNKCAILPLQLHGFDVSPINSVQFSNHTGYKAGWNGDALEGEQLESLVEGLERNNLINFSHLLTGYMRSNSFVYSVVNVINKLREKQPGLIYLCDPVLGDEGKLYVPEELVNLYRTEVIQHATILTPNQFECETLTGIKIKNMSDAALACEKLHDIGIEVIVITSLDFIVKDNVVVFCSAPSHKVPPPPSSSSSSRSSSKRSDYDIDSTSPDNESVLDKRYAQFTLQTRRYPFHFTGTGDLFSALILACVTKYPDNIKLAIEEAFSGVQSVCNRTFECYQEQKQKLLNDYSSNSRKEEEGLIMNCSYLELKLVQCVEELMSPNIVVKAQPRV